VAYLFPQVGYCQGMNFIASVVLEICGHQEWLAMYILISFLQDKHLRMEALFLQGLPELHVMNYTFEKCIQKHSPRLFAHFKQVDMKPEYFTFKWSMTLFCCFLPVSILPQILTQFVFSKWPSIYQIGVTLLNSFMASRILEMDNMMEISAFMRDQMRKSDTLTP
jgi:hypothetical protein